MTCFSVAPALHWKKVNRGFKPFLAGLNHCMREVCVVISDSNMDGTELSSFCHFKETLLLLYCKVNDME